MKKVINDDNFNKKYKFKEVSSDLKKISKMIFWRVVNFLKAKKSKIKIETSTNYQIRMQINGQIGNIIFGG